MPAHTHACLCIVLVVFGVPLHSGKYLVVGQGLEAYISSRGNRRQMTLQIWLLAYYIVGRTSTHRPQLRFFITRNTPNVLWVVAGL
jgi:hypothetical protein